MGYGLQVYAVPLADLERVPGSGDETIVRDAIAGSRVDPAIHGAIGAIVDGTATDRERAPQYGYALERICRALGERLENGPFLPSSLDALRALDAELRARGVRFATIDLALGRAPIRIPTPDDFPLIGTVGPAILAEAAIDVAAAPPAHEAEWRTIAGWLERVRERAADDPDGRWALVGLWY